MIIKCLDQQHENKHKEKVCVVEGAVAANGIGVSVIIRLMVKFRVIMSELYRSIIQGQLWIMLIILTAWLQTADANQPIQAQL